VAGLDLFPTGNLQRTHAVLAGALREGAGAFAFDDEVVEFVVGFEDLEDADAAAVTGVAAAVAADGLFERVDEVEQSGQRRRTRRCAMTSSIAEVTRKGSIPMSIRRVSAPGASLV
jgi:hypothetical protein